MNGAGTIHASVALVGTQGVLIRGASGSGKSSLLLALIGLDPERNALVADDRVVVAAANGHVIASVPPELAGLVEVRGQGIMRRPYVSPAVVDLIVDIASAQDCQRLPAPEDVRIRVAGIDLPRLMLPAGSADGALRVTVALGADSYRIP